MKMRARKLWIALTLLALVLLPVTLLVLQHRNNRIGALTFYIDLYDESGSPLLIGI